MDAFVYRHDQLFAEDVPVTQLAQRFGTPCYVYSRAAIVGVGWSARGHSDERSRSER